MRYKANFECPECKEIHNYIFNFYEPEDGDEETESMECQCGCEFDITCGIEVDFDFDLGKPTITKSGIKQVEFDINDTSTWQIENNPNQLNLL